MATTNFKLFDENKGNILSDTEYNTSAQRLNGVQTGVASSQLQNKFAYQVSLVAYAIAQLMNANGLDANDTLTVSAFVANCQGAILQKVADKATTAQAQAGTDNAKWMTPALVTAAINYVKAHPITFDSNVQVNGTLGVSGKATLAGALDVGGVTTFKNSVNVNNKNIYNVPSPKSASSVTPKSYVDTTAANAANAAPYLKLVNVMNKNVNITSPSPTEVNYYPDNAIDITNVIGFLYVVAFNSNMILTNSNYSASFSIKTQSNKTIIDNIRTSGTIQTNGLKVFNVYILSDYVANFAGVNTYNWGAISSLAYASKTIPANSIYFKVQIYNAGSINVSLSFKIYKIMANLTI